MVSSPALHKDGGRALDLLTIALKTDSNKPSRLRILETAGRIVSSQVTKVLPPHLLRGLKASSPYLYGVVLSGFMEILKEK
jgi:hypothetical protein